jgi:hypothetical protein
MWNNLQSVIHFFVPEKIEDDSQKTTDIKLASGIVFGFFLVAIAFALLTGVGQVVIEEAGAFKVTNATIIVLLGCLFVWLTLTKVGIKHGDPKK